MRLCVRERVCVVCAWMHATITIFIGCINNALVFDFNRNLSLSQRFGLVSIATSTCYKHIDAVVKITFYIRHRAILYISKWSFFCRSISRDSCSLARAQSDYLRYDFCHLTLNQSSCEWVFFARETVRLFFCHFLPIFFQRRHYLIQSRWTINLLIFSFAFWIYLPCSSVVSTHTKRTSRTISIKKKMEYILQ